MLSSRLPPHGDLNALTRAVAALRERGEPFVDLTISNPTAAGFDYPPALLRPLASPAGLRYEPSALGLPSARAAIAADATRRGAVIDPDALVLTASTSEAYGWLFKLLCEPGDIVLVPQPSYPLFDYLTRLESVRGVPYRLEYHGRWSIDFSTVEAAPPRTRAVLVVSPNNPTGSYVSAHEVERLGRLCHARGWALIVDEVFADYPLDERAPVTDLAAYLDVPSFTLGGASKSLGLPQIKLGWILVGGSPAERRAAISGLELIADTFLSVSTPVQIAAPELLSAAASIRESIHGRVRANLAAARGTLERFPSCELLAAGGGWSAVLRVPARVPEERLVLDLLDAQRVLVHPGFFFDFEKEAFLVVSLLPPEPAFADAWTRVVAQVA
jgi:aspartate/methionine/tyrosine aminotransferase